MRKRHGSEYLRQVPLDALAPPVLKVLNPLVQVRVRLRGFRLCALDALLLLTSKLANPCLSVRLSAFVGLLLRCETLVRPSELLGVAPLTADGAGIG